MKNFKLREQAIQKEKGRMGSEHEHLSHGRLFCDVSRKDHRAVHAKDTSKKIRSVLKAKGNSGKHLSVIPPFGYKKDPNDKEKWLIDEEDAQIVKKIFRMYLDCHIFLWILNY